MADYDLLVLGDANPDLVLSGDQVEPAFGQAERLVDHATLTIGGSGAILACGAARLGLRVAFAGVVGDDLFGAFMREQLTARGVDIGGVVVDPRRPTGVTVVLSGPEDRAILTSLGTIGDLRAALIDPGTIASTRHVHVSSYFLQRGLAAELPEIFERVHRAGATTSVDPNWDPSEGWDGGLIDLLPQVDVFLPNEMEALRLAHISDIDEAVTRLRARAPFVVIKRGDRGALGARTGELVEVPAIPTRVVDATGAGDSFDAGFLTAFLSGEPLDVSLRIANACGALSTRSSGGTDGQPTMDEVLGELERGSAA
ncbi:MAG: carbohydrate kinase family protein [Actinomycetota bacterium]